MLDSLKKWLWAVYHISYRVFTGLVIGASFLVVLLLVCYGAATIWFHAISYSVTEVDRITDSVPDSPASEAIREKKEK